MGPIDNKSMQRVLYTIFEIALNKLLAEGFLRVLLAHRDGKALVSRLLMADQALHSLS